VRGSSQYQKEAWEKKKREWKNFLIIFFESRAELVGKKVGKKRGKEGQKMGAGLQSSGQKQQQKKIGKERDNTMRCLVALERRWDGNINHREPREDMGKRQRQTKVPRKKQKDDQEE